MEDLQFEHSGRFILSSPTLEDRVGMGIQCFWFHIMAVYPLGLFEDVALESEGRLWSFLGGEFISYSIAWAPSDIWLSVLEGDSFITY
jgi:hypothetical protein